MAGVIMWVPAGIFFLVPIAWLFVKSFQSAGQRRVLGQTVSILLMVCLLPAVLSGCSDVKSQTDTSAAETLARGKALIARIWLRDCHTIPGIANATGRVGPPLSGIADRVFIAGMLQNNTENLTKWISDPQSRRAGKCDACDGYQAG